MNKSLYDQSFSVPFRYPVWFTRHLFSPENPLLPETLNRLQENRRHRAVVFIDDGVAAAHPHLIDDITGCFARHSEQMVLAGAPALVPGGETAKNDWKYVHQVIDEISRHHLDRQSYVIAIGGGAVLDMVGFGTAIVHRGLRMVRVPTTTLAQNDAGIGVKNGINAQGQKNFIGTFAPPFAVLNDSHFLTTLDFDQWIGGVSEAFKVALIKDAEFFDYLINHARSFRSRNLNAMETLVYRCAALHLAHIGTSGDPFEFGSARPLDFGHWAAHQLETLTGYEIGHGQAVAVGICLDACIAMKLGLLRSEELDRILDGFVAAGLPVWDERLARQTGGRLDILGGLEAFREHLGGQLTITLPDGIGRKKEVHHIAPEAVEESVERLEQYHRQMSRRQNV